MNVETRIVNSDQAAAWNGAEGAHWADHDDRVSGANAALQDHLFGAAAVAPADFVLDIGCGTGETTRLAAARAPDGLAVGIDLSAPMLEQARTAAERDGLANIRFVQGDAQVHPFPDGDYDVVISQFGIMFFADPVAAFANIARALRPGGRLVFVCPRDMELCEWYTVPLRALLRMSAEEAPGSAPDALPESGMFSLSRRSVIVDVLAAAGLHDVVTRPVDVPLPFGRDAEEAAGFYLGSGPVRALLEERPEVTPGEARDVLVAALRPFEGADGLRVPGAHWLVTARRG
jgi:SAM-dependent methyltransferase